MTDKSQIHSGFVFVLQLNFIFEIFHKNVEKELKIFSGISKL